MQRGAGDGGAVHFSRRWLDPLDATGRWALLKLLTGALRVGVSARLAKTGARRMVRRVVVDDIEEVWHGLTPPYTELFAWLAGQGPRPEHRRTRSCSGR